MKTINLKLFSFNELPENIQDRIVQNWRNDEQYFWAGENSDSLNRFADIFGIKIKDYDYGYRNYITAAFNLDDDLLDLSGIRLAKYIWNNYRKYLFKGRFYYRNGKNRRSKILIESDCPFTGYYVDNACIMPLLDFMDNPDNRDFRQLLNDCLDCWLDCCRNDYDYWMSREAIIEDILSNDYQFLGDGEIATNLETMAA